LLSPWCELARSARETEATIQKPADESSERKDAGTRLAAGPHPGQDPVQNELALFSDCSGPAVDPHLNGLSVPHRIAFIHIAFAVQIADLRIATLL